MPPPSLAVLAAIAREKKDLMNLYREESEKDPNYYSEADWVFMKSDYDQAAGRLWNGVMSQLRLCRDRYPQTWAARFSQIMASAMMDASKDSEDIVPTSRQDTDSD